MYPFSSLRSLRSLRTRSQTSVLCSTLFGKSHFLINSTAKWRGASCNSRFFLQMFHVLETRLLDAPRHFAVDSPKHCKGCKTKNMNLKTSQAISMFFFYFATLTVFWRCATCHENSHLEQSPYLISRIWSRFCESSTF